jgi:two-component system, NtrC family, sensor kinase
MRDDDRALGFDREWQFAELLDEVALERIGPGLAELLGGDVAVLDGDGGLLWGRLSADARREPLVLELEPIGFIASNSAPPTALHGCRSLLLALLRSEIRYRMAASLHLEAVAEDFETLRREHARLLESEARYKKLSEDLDARVKAQVSQLEERQQMLYQAEKLASVGQLAAGMAHEINNPLGFVRSNLNSFRGYLEKFEQFKAHLDQARAAWNTLDLDFVLEDGIDLLDDSAQGIERIARIVSDLKSFSNVDRANEEFTDLNTCLRHAASILEESLPAGITVNLELQPLPNIVCLPGHLNQLFFNLIRNSIQAIEDAGRPGEVRVSSDQDSDGIHIRIQDNGVGMTPHQLEHAFEPFFTTRPVGAGAGLGLSTARNIVLAHSGRIELLSEPELGTTVTLFFPRPS